MPWLNCWCNLRVSVDRSQGRFHAKFRPQRSSWPPSLHTALTISTASVHRVCHGRMLAVCSQQDEDMIFFEGSLVALREERTRDSGGKAGKIESLPLPRSCRRIVPAPGPPSTSPRAWESSARCVGRGVSIEGRGPHRSEKKREKKLQLDLNQLLMSKR